MPKEINIHPVLVRILIDRYEDSGEGYMSQADALSSAKDYLATLISNPATDKLKDGTIDRSLVAKAERFDVIGEWVEDNGEECDGEDIGRWTISFEIVACFIVVASSRKEAEEITMQEIESIISDPMCDSVEDWACNFSSDILRAVTK